MAEPVNAVATKPVRTMSGGERFIRTTHPLVSM